MEGLSNVPCAIPCSHFFIEADKLTIETRTLSEAFMWFTQTELSNKPVTVSIVFQANCGEEKANIKLKVELIDNNVLLHTNKPFSAMNGDLEPHLFTCSRKVKFLGIFRE